ncbi:MAG: hypothetical protein EAX96_09010 [Candidatus Lokiarchaeota archaeon]|nr:hypothetical protein [Candidatus Lokiarchaeota archaeon]
MQTITADQILLLVWILVLIFSVSILTWLTVRLSEGKSSEEGKRYFKALVVTVLGTVAAVAIYMVFGMYPWGAFISGAAPYLVYIVWLGLSYWIFDLQWKSAILVAFVALLFIVIFISILQYIQIDLWYFNALVA